MTHTTSRIIGIVCFRVLSSIEWTHCRTLGFGIWVTCIAQRRLRLRLFWQAMEYCVSAIFLSYSRWLRTQRRRKVITSSITVEPVTAFPRSGTATFWINLSSADLRAAEWGHCIRWLIISSRSHICSQMRWLWRRYQCVNHSDICRRICWRTWTLRACYKPTIYCRRRSWFLTGKSRIYIGRPTCADELPTD